MELETLFTASKWEILQRLSEEPLSPLQLAERSSTSLANISQQLRLLEMAGLVTSERIPNRERGQPRILYRLAQDQGFLIAAANDFVEKRLFRLSGYNKAVLRIWLYEDGNTRYVLEKAFWHVEHLLPRMRALGIRSATGRKVTFCVVSDELAQEDLPGFTITDHDGEEVAVAFELCSHCDRGSLLYTR